MANDGYITLPGTDEYIECTPLAVGSGDLEMRMYCASDNWNVLQILSGQWSSTAADQAYFWQTTTTSMQIQVAALTGNRVFTVTLPAWTDSVGRWLKVEYEYDNGTSNSEARFYTSTDAVTTDPDSVSWSQVGASQTSVVDTGRKNSGVKPPLCGSRDSSSGPKDFFDGTVMYWDILDGLGGTIKVQGDYRTGPDFTGSPPERDDDNNGSLVHKLSGTSPSYTPQIVPAQVYQSSLMAATGSERVGTYQSSLMAATGSERVGTYQSSLMIATVPADASDNLLPAWGINAVIQ